MRTKGRGRYWGRVVVAGTLLAGVLGMRGQPVAAATSCSRTLVLSAFPAEMDAWLRAVPNFNPRRSARVVNGRTFYLGFLRGHRVVMAMTGIGPVNAEQTTSAAIAHFRCGTDTAISHVVFSGVAGSTYNIGDVAVPDSWIDEHGTTWPVDAGLLNIARQLPGNVALERQAPIGDPACTCLTDPSAVKFVTMPHPLKIVVGGTGATTDPVFGRAFPCIPDGGDVFGCSPCRVHPVPNPIGLLHGFVPFLDPQLFLAFISSPPATSSSHVADDEETGAVLRVASQHGIPFIGFRGVSDGPGDPLHLPGFPVSFFVYRQISADNAARAMLAFLRLWPG